MVTSLREPMSVKFKMWNELAHAVFCAQLGLACVLCNEVCSVTGADVFKIEHRGDLADHDTGPTLVMILLTDVTI